MVFKLLPKTKQNWRHEFSFIEFTETWICNRGPVDVSLVSVPCSLCHVIIDVYWSFFQYLGHFNVSSVSVSCSLCHDITDVLVLLVSVYVPCSLCHNITDIPVLLVSISVPCSLCHDITDVPVPLVSVSVPPLIAPAGHGLTLPHVTALSRQWWLWWQTPTLLPRVIGISHSVNALSVRDHSAQWEQ